MKVARIDDWELAYWVAIAENLSPLSLGKICATSEKTNDSYPIYENTQFVGYSFEPHIKWSQGGPLIDKYAVSIYPNLDELGWYAHARRGRGTRMEGLSPLVAAMRSIIATKFGKDINEQRRIFCIANNPVNSVVRV